MPKKKLLIVQIAALSTECAERLNPVPGGITFKPLQSVFPAVTCTAQASFRTGTLPSQHGMISNGVYHHRLKKILFWEQAASLVAGPRIWDTFRARGGTVGILFWQQSLGESADLIVSPRPIHKHSGGMIQDVYTEPHGLYDSLCKQIGRKFNLMNYWGPLASHKSSDWIVESIGAVLSQPDLAPDLLLAYLPNLDYDLQRHGSGHPSVQRAINQTQAYLDTLYAQAQAAGYELLLVGDYAIRNAPHGAVLPNLALREAGLFLTQNVKGMAYPDFFAGKAFAMVDHEVAHVYVPDTARLTETRDLLSALSGVEKVLDREAQARCGLDHANSGDFVLVAEEGYWFAYPWWTDNREAPDFSTHVDIHNKPGFDACELFFGWPPGSVSRDTSRVKGSHGKTGPGREIAWGTTLNLPGAPTDLAELGQAVKAWLDGAHASSGSTT